VRPITVVAVGACIAAVAAGFVVGNSRADDAEPANTAAPPRVSAGGLSLSLPTDWQRLDAIPGVLRTRLRSPLALGQRDRVGAGGLVTGVAAAQAPDFVPASTRAALPSGALADRQRVRLGNLEAFRYANLVPSGFEGTLTLYVVPQTAKDVTLLGCFLNTGAPQSIVTGCEDIAATLAVEGSRPVALAPTARYAATLNGTIRTLTTQRAAALVRLRKATAPAAQAGGADAVARSYATAAARLRKEPVTLFTGSTNAALVAALENARAAYSSLGKAARSGDQADYNAARRQITRSQTQLDGALDGLRDLGFAFE
jgi:hypothetical protein